MSIWDILTSASAKESWIGANVVDVEAVLRNALADPTGTYSFPLSVLVRRWDKNIAWYIDRLSKSTAGVRGKTNVTF